MPGIRQKVAIAISAGALAAGLFGTFEPRSDSTDARRQPAAAQQNVRQLSHASERTKEGYLAAGAAQADAENARSLTPGEYRPPEVPDIRLRLIP
jgi:hypothetical protein